MEQVSEVLKHAKALLLPNEHRKKPMLDALPIWAPIAGSVFFVLIFLILLLINGIWRIDGLVREENMRIFGDNIARDFLYNGLDLNENGQPPGVQESHFVKLNDFLKVFIYFEKQSVMKNVQVSEQNIKLSYKLDLYRKETLGKPYDTIKNDVTANLNCPLSNTHSNEDLRCDGILLYFSETVPTYQYDLHVRLKDTPNSLPLLNDTVTIGWRYDGSGWLIFEMVVSFLIWAGVIVLFVAWMLILCAFNGFNNWSIEQRMVKVLFILAILYVNPFYYIDDVYDSSWVTYVFKFGDAVCLVTFVVWMWFCLHMFTHWIGQPKAKRSIVIWVYSIILAILFWVFLFVIMLSWRYTRSFAIFFQSIGYAMIVTQCFLFPFHLVRLVVLLTKQQIEETYETVKRMIFLFGITLPTCFGVFLMLVVKPWTDQLNNWFYQILMLLILLLLAIQFLPSWKVVDPPKEDYTNMSSDLYGGSRSSGGNNVEHQSIIGTTTDGNTIQEEALEDHVL